MIKKEKDKAPPIKPKDNINQRQKDIEAVFNLSINESALFDTVNIAAWKTAFHKYANSIDPDRLFMFRKTDKSGKSYRVWRIERNTID